MGQTIDDAVAKWKRRGYREDAGSLGVLELVKFRSVSTPWLVFWTLLGLLPGAIYYFYAQLKSDERLRFTVSESGKVVVERRVSLLTRLGPLFGAAVLLPVGTFILYTGVLKVRAVSREEAERTQAELAAIQPVFTLAGTPVFVPGTATQGPVLKWEGMLTNQSATAWTGAEVVCRLKFRRGKGEVEDRESRSALAGGRNTWKLEPQPTPEQPWPQGEARKFKCETLPGKHVGIAQPESVVLDVIVPAKGGHYPWTSGALPVPPPSAGR
jgi:hypothetical protein